MPSKFLTKRIVLAIHRDQIETFGGKLGIRDEAALESALAQPQATFGKKLLHSSITDQAGAYLFHLVQDHPFVDGNKRIGLAAMDTFLRLNGYELKLNDERLYELVMAVASGELSKDALSTSLRSCVRRRSSGAALRTTEALTPEERSARRRLRPDRIGRRAE